ALLAVLPGAAVSPLAARGDVDAIVPNRIAYRTVSYIQQTTGASSAQLLKNWTPYDGTGVGIAILDSGIDSCHAAFGASLRGNSSVCSTAASIKKTVDLTRLSAGLSSRAVDWTRSVDLSASYYPGSVQFRSYQNAI